MIHDVAFAIKLVRQSQNISINELSRRCRTPRQQIGKIENRRAVPTIASLEKISHALGISLCGLLVISEVHQSKKTLDNDFSRR